MLKSVKFAYPATADEESSRIDVDPEKKLDKGLNGLVYGGIHRYTTAFSPNTEIKSEPKQSNKALQIQGLQIAIP